MSKTHILQRIQTIPTTLETAWNFFSNPSNLGEITPAEMDFKVISTNHSEKMYAGRLIEYYVKPIFGIRIYWMTEITHVEDQKYFVDEQRIGPYSLWHHQHHFKEIQGGVEMTDVVHYRIPYGFIGGWMNALFIRKRVEEIFDYRFKVIEKKFD